MEFNEFKFTDKIYFSSLNKFNFAIRNGYMSNLLCTAFATIPVLIKYVKNLDVACGFINDKISKDFFKCDNIAKSGVITGNAIAFTWDNYNMYDAINLFNDIYDKFDGVSVVIEYDKAWFVNGCKDIEVYRIIDNVCTMVGRKEKTPLSKP
jgi:hypothetical protein